MELLFCGSIPKNDCRPYENEDYYNISTAGQNVRIAVSDGATVSYDSRNWAKSLADYFIQKGIISNKNMNKLIKSYYSDCSSRFDFKNLTLFQRRGLRFGSYATILGVEYNSNLNLMQLVGVGDSIAVLLDNYVFVDSFPYSLASDYRKDPKLLSVKKRHNYFFSHSKEYGRFYKLWELSSICQPILLCMTDALGEWAFKSYENGNANVWMELAGITDIIDFERFVDKKRADGIMKIDDTTLICMRF
ncbi:MAG: hypothetical protein LBF13_03830 [Campylobacteraceae bacterium]|jgi:hypothetical protein|nr:hypothetical protein [Campylobacteraceae bacterium]